jgi:hypothetical protein
VIPNKLRHLVDAQVGDVRRSDASLARRALADLGISATSEFGEFFVTYRIIGFTSARSSERLVDLVEPSAAIKMGSDFVHEVWALPARWIAISSCEAEGAYLYDKETGAVFDFELANRDVFLAGRQSPRWNGFFEFMAWYLSPPAGSPGTIQVS